MEKNRTQKRASEPGHRDGTEECCADVNNLSNSMNRIEMYIVDIHYRPLTRAGMMVSIFTVKAVILMLRLRTSAICSPLHVICR